MNLTFTGYSYVQKTSRMIGGGCAKVSGSFRTVPQRKWFALLAVALVLAIPGLAAAQTSAVTPRINAQIDNGTLTVVHGNTHPLAKPQYDQGKASPSFNLERITMMFQPTAAQQADLTSLLAAQQNPTSPSFHQWLMPAQYADRFGISPSDLSKVTAWLQAQGFTVVETPPSRTWIVFGGTAAQVESAFHTEIHNYAANGKTFYANSAEPSVPAALAGIVLGFRGLNNFPVKPRSIKKSGSVQPNFTSGISGNHFVAPGDFATIYDLKPLYGRTPAINGTGQKIVIVGQSNIVLADIAAFRTASGLSPNVPTLTLVPGSTDPGVLNSTGDEQESSIDIEWSGAVATNATIIFVVSNNGVFDSLQYAIGQDLAPVISISYGSCEPENELSDINFLVAMAQQANALGITIVSAVGDGGATDCDGDLGDYPATLGLNVDVPGSLPYVTGVGGTEFDEGNGAYWQPQGSSDIINSALSYIPEMVWNDTSSANGLSAGGGGASSIFGKPSWQTGTGVPADGVRDVPDIAINASPAHDSYLVCLQFQPQGQTTFTSNCLNGTFRYSDNTLQAYGGTSFGGPTFGGILALVNQETGSNGQGNVNYILYPLAASSPAAFHDITTGNNSSPCVLGSENCPNSTPIGFSAGTGYDQATGLGTIDATNLVSSWSTITASAGSTPTLSSISPTSATAGSAGFTLTATGSNFATNAQILWNGSTSGVTMLAGGTSTTIKATISSSLVAFGTVASITVTDDASKAGESSVSQSFTVNGIPPVNDDIANAIAVTSNNFVSIVDNSAATTEATDPTPPCVVGSTNPRTKTVWWTLTPGTSGTVTATTIGSVYDTTLSVWTGTPGNLTNVACNDDVASGVYTQSALNFSAIAGTKYYFMVAPFGPPDTGSDLLGGKTVLNVTNENPASSQAPAITSANSATFTVGIAGSFTVTATGNPAPTFSESGSLPSGVTFTFGGVLSGIPAAGTAANYPILITAQNGVLPNATQNFSLTVNQGPTFTLAPTTNTATVTIPTPGQSVTQLITATGANGFAGTVTLSYAVTNSPTGAVDLPTCSFGVPDQNFTSPNSITLNAGSETGKATMTCSSTAASRTLFRPSSRPSRPGRPLAAAAVSLVCFFFLLGVQRQRRWAFAPLAVLLFAVIVAGVGCGSSSSSGEGGGGGGNPGTTTGAYTVTVTATPSTGTAQITSITVNVQ